LPRSRASGAETYPSKPIRLLVPLAAGSTADIVSRFAAEQVGKALGQSIVVENKPGAGGTIAMAELARAAPDGYTIAFASQGTLVFNQAIYANPGYDSAKDFAPVSFVGGVSNVMIVPAAKRPREACRRDRRGQDQAGAAHVLVRGQRHEPSPVGRAVRTPHGTDLVHVPYKGAPQGVLAVMTGEVSMGFFNTPTVIGQIKDGKVKALGVTSLARSPLLPNVPTLDEQGVKGYEVNTWFGFVAPAKTPPEIVARLNAELNKIFASAEAREKLGPQGFDLRRRWRRPRSTSRRRRPRNVGADRQGVGGNGELTPEHPVRCPCEAEPRVYGSSLRHASSRDVVVGRSQQGPARRVDQYRDARSAALERRSVVSDPVRDLRGLYEWDFLATPSRLTPEYRDGDADDHGRGKDVDHPREAGHPFHRRSCVQGQGSRARRGGLRLFAEAGAGSRLAARGESGRGRPHRRGACRRRRASKPGPLSSMTGPSRDCVHSTATRSSSSSRTTNYPVIEDLITNGAVAREVVEAAGGDVRTRAVGTGPYRLKEWKQGSRMILEANPDYRALSFPESRDPRDATLAASMRGVKLPQIGAIEIAFRRRSDDANARVRARHAGLRGAERRGRDPPAGERKAQARIRRAGHRAPCRAESIRIRTGLEHVRSGPGRNDKARVALRRAIAKAVDATSWSRCSTRARRWS
jgi:tripartite-type tricarboxylate transporter receptor subunit TctC